MCVYVRVREREERETVCVSVCVYQRKGRMGGGVKTKDNNGEGKKVLNYNLQISPLEINTLCVFMNSIPVSG